MTARLLTILLSLSSVGCPPKPWPKIKNMQVLRSWTEHRYDFKHVTSSPRFPQSNGLAEKGVEIVKRIMKKITETREYFWLGLLTYRSAPLEDGRSPGELLQGRRLRTRLPNFSACPRKQALRRQPRQLSSRKALPELQNDAVVRVRGDTWDRNARVMDLVAPRCYGVATEDNQILRRNRQHLLATRELFQTDLGESESESEEVSQATMPRRASPSEPTATTPFQATTAASQSTMLPTQAVPRRSTRQRQQPNRLHYGRDFKRLVSYSQLITLSRGKMYRQVANALLERPLPIRLINEARVCYRTVSQSYIHL
ncbi:uncharacterized protein LOC142573217 isoform X2 [Dermacentor variabilis]|uniref:uncharacterized protein LOC142573217 isoform X2 n=1 Tax=Dermacentor variabilis TaxID=34621 RepID=UPI003F5C2BFB